MDCSRKKAVFWTGNCKVRNLEAGRVATVVGVEHTGALGAPAGVQIVNMIVTERSWSFSVEDETVTTPDGATWRAAANCSNCWPLPEEKRVAGAPHCKELVQATMEIELS